MSYKLWNCCKYYLIENLFPHPNISKFHLLSYLTSLYFPLLYIRGIIGVETRGRTKEFIMIFMALNFILENYFDDVLFFANYFYGIKLDMAWNHNLNCVQSLVILINIAKVLLALKFRWLERSHFILFYYMMETREMLDQDHTIFLTYQVKTTTFGATVQFIPSVA